jgi:hypothetical protein
MLIVIENLKCKIKYYEVNKESKLHISNGTYNPSKLPKRVENTMYAKLAPTALVTQNEYDDKYCITSH